MSRKYTDKEARAFMLKARLRPMVTYQSNHTPWKCLCLKCKRVVTPTLAQVRSRGTGCKYCGRRAVDPIEAKELFNKKALDQQSINEKILIAQGQCIK